ncbi:YdbH domain-containing protein [Caulobacter segnis]|uniref:intermembrane phospholipid transport protein YdbH family protein n=1 Tax=Caulobacter segnis TaxID=88688 RepID=UPI00240F4499|nr:YdbH domain-containing protein [Caulobacter segnis]MDG2521638.1 YdbH domain-containing protein [Caulobacter segnis]
MTETTQNPEPTARPAPSRRARLAAVALEVGAVALWSVAAGGLIVLAQRREIARELAVSWLRERGVEAAVDIRALDVDGFVGRVRVGSEADPIFTAERLEVAYALTPPWAGDKFAIETRAVRLVRPQLKAAFINGKLSFGALDPLIEDFTKTPRPEQEGGPAVLIQSARIDLGTDFGRVTLIGDGAMDQGALLRLDGALMPARLRKDDLTLATNGGRFSLRKHDARLRASLHLSPSTLTQGATRLEGLEGDLAGELPYPDLRGMSAAGPASLQAALKAGRGQMGEASINLARLKLDWNGSIFGYPERAALSGRLDASLTADRIAQAGQAARDVEARLLLDGFRFNHDKAGDTFEGAARIQASADALDAGGLDLQRVALGARTGRMSARNDTQGFTLNGQFAVDGGASTSAATARRISARTPVVAQNPAYQAALTRNLTRLTLHAPSLAVAIRPDSLKATASRPLTVRGASGARVTLDTGGGSLIQAVGGAASGAARVELAGGGLPTANLRIARWTSGARGVEAALSLDAKLDVPPLQNLTLKGDARAAGRDGLWTVRLDRCADAEAEKFVMGETSIDGIAAQVCANGPILQVGPNGWRADGRLTKARAGLTAAESELAGGEAAFRLSGANGAMNGEVKLSAAKVVDRQPAPRFNPIFADGTIRLARNRWNGPVTVRTEAGRPLARIDVVHDMNSGVGSAVIDASQISFMPDGLQPSEISPMAAPLENAQGALSFTGRFDWNAAGMTSSGRLAGSGLSFKGPAGLSSGAAVDIAFTSLTPLISAPAQTATIARVEAFAPVEQVAAAFHLEEKAFVLEGATAQTLKGVVRVEPMTVGYEGGVIRGAVVLEGIQLGELVTSTSLVDRLQINGLFDGRIPFEIDGEKIRVHDGKLTGRPGGRLSISRSLINNTTANGQQVESTNAIQDFAYQAMENLDYAKLEATVNSTDSGRLGILFHIEGQHAPKVKEKARVGILDAIRGRAFNKRIALPAGTPVNLTLDTSFNLDDLLAGWRRKWADPQDTPSRSGAVQP